MEVVVSFDVETTGGTPAIGSMVMLGCVPIIYPKGSVPTEKHIGVKKAWYLKEDNGREERCMTEFWSAHPDNLTTISERAVPPSEAMHDFAAWYTTLLKVGPVKFMAGPAGFDWSFLNFYYSKYKPVAAPSLGYAPVCLSAIWRISDMFPDVAKPTLSSTDVYKPMFNPTDAPFPKGVAMTHMADDDALYQAHCYVRLVNNFTHIIETGKESEKEIESLKKEILERMENTKDLRKENESLKKEILDLVVERKNLKKENKGMKVAVTKISSQLETLCKMITS